MNRSSVFLEVIENLSKSIHISEGDDIAMAKDILYNASNFLKIQRANAWLMDEEEQKLVCLIAYDRSKDDFYSEGELRSTDFPVYFNHITRNDIIISFDAQNEPFNQELIEPYLKPHNIFSMMEVPILSAGKMKGIICFENIGEIRKWNNDEQHFALAISQLLTLTLETKEKNQYREELEKLVKEKSVLISEINHRVKNNLAVISALIRSESNRAKDAYHRDLFNNILSKAFSLSSLQDAMYHSQNYKQVNFSEFLETLLKNMNETYGNNLNVQIEAELGTVMIDVSKAIPCSLIVNELLTNCFKYAFSLNHSNKLNIKLSTVENLGFQLMVKDNGPGLPENFKNRGTGFELIDGLIDQLDALMVIDSTKEGTTITISF